MVTMATVVLGLLLPLAETVTVCYLGSWAVWRPDAGKYDVDEIDPFLCTHVIYSYAKISETTWEAKPLEPYYDLCENWGLCAYDRFTALKAANPDLKALLSVGGDAKIMSQLSADPQKREAFIASAVSLAKNHSFDGLDSDWMYPGNEDGTPEDKENYILLLTELREVLTKEGLLLTTAVSLQKPIIDKAYDIPALSGVTDLLLLRGYNFHGTFNTYTHHHAPLYAHPEDAGINLFLNIDYGLQYWISGGADKSKLVLGLGTFGNCWTLDSTDDTDYYASATQAGEPGPYTAALGILGYNEICEMQRENEWTVVKDPDMNEPYAYYEGNKIWCGYEDAMSMWVKGQYARSQGLAGMMVWSLETDDFSGSCSGRPYNLIRTMEEGFLDLPFSTPVPPTVRPETTPEPLVTPECSEGNYYLQDIQCNKYWHCVNGNAIPGECSTGLVWDMALESCSWPESVDTSQCVMPGQETTITSTTSTVSTEPTTTSTVTTELATVAPALKPECGKEKNYFVNHPVCNKYWWCLSGEAVLGTCHGGLVWDPSTQVCLPTSQANPVNCTML
ncbi:chitinase-3-like protein 1 isoform X2 [Penaeus japonicus]|uniref:chitinase-3-like protein 1 isoform X2 n=1 Tax=Penaeus japonicus TaxID=27405 RepID=UPI001C70CAE2|nr:chitinase-3-like protein 1 isoform X2 [Penaeus japonicus]